MSKITTAIVAPEATPAAPAAPAPTIVQPKPQAISLNGPAWTALNKMTALIRMGYMPTTVQTYPTTGHMNIELQLGNPDPSFTAAAEVEVDDAAALAEIQRNRDIRAAAEQIVKDQTRAAAQAAMAVKVAQHEAELAAMKAAAEALA